MILPSATSEATFQPIETSILEEAAPLELVEVGLDEDTVEIWRVVMDWEEDDVVNSVVPFRVPVLVPVLVPLLLVVFVEFPAVVVVTRVDVLLPLVELVLDEETELDVGLLLMAKVGLVA